MAHVLIVDGNRHEALQSLSLPLRQSGFDAVTATTLAEALSAVDLNAPGILISELQLPDGTGLELLQHLRAKGSSIPFVIITRSPSIRTAVQAIQSGAHDYLEKPLAPSLAVRLVETLIGPSDQRYQAAVSPVAIHALRVIHREFRRPGLSTRMIAKEVGVSVEHVCRLVKAHTGRSVLSIVRERRVTEAAVLLRRSPLLVKEISYALGFRTLSMCERDFRRHFRCSPTEYRARCRTEPSISDD